MDGGGQNGGGNAPGASQALTVCLGFNPLGPGVSGSKGTAMAPSARLFRGALALRAERLQVAAPAGRSYRLVWASGLCPLSHGPPLRHVRALTLFLPLFLWPGHPGPRRKATALAEWPFFSVT